MPIRHHREEPLSPPPTNSADRAPTMGSAPYKKDCWRQKKKMNIDTAPWPCMPRPSVDLGVAGPNLLERSNHDFDETKIKMVG